MIRDIGQRDHEKRRKSGIVRGRGKAGGMGGGGVIFFFFFFGPRHPPPLPGLALPGLLRGLQKP